jgi:peroxiredoxin
MRFLKLISICLLLFQSCGNEIIPKLGEYRAEIKTKDNSILPFKFELINESNKLIMVVENDKETLIYDDIIFEADSLKILMPPYDAVIIAKVENESLYGRYLKEESGKEAPFYAKINNESKFQSNKKANFSLNGKYKTVFRPENPYPGLGVFNQKGNEVSGTFRKNTGDTRFLSGITFGDSILLSTFDGAHPYLIKAEKKGDTIFGNLHYYNDSITEFWMIEDQGYELADSKTLTKLKDGVQSINFNFKDTNGKFVSLNDIQFKDKVVVVQILGTWCPNCLDETQFFLSYIEENPNEDLAFVGLSVEAAKTEQKAMNRIKNMIDKFNIPYPILLAQYGGTDKEKFLKKIPMLENIISYPTTIIIDKSGKVNSIHTGFNGPATGQAYEDYKEDFKTEIKGLLEL